MLDFSKSFSLLERIDKQYSKHISMKKQINEAMKDTFSYDELEKIQTQDFMRGSGECVGALNYCKDQLGPSIGEGSSRAVFQIDDEKCLKLAYNRKGVQQNKVELSVNPNKSPLFPIVFKASKNNYWIETEAVLPAQEEDWEQCLNMDVYDFFSLCYEISNSVYSSSIKQNVEDFIATDKSGMLKELYNYIVDNDIPVGDIVRVENWGLAKRNGKEYLVLLDAGWNQETMRMYAGVFYS